MIKNSSDFLIFIFLMHFINLLNIKKMTGQDYYKAYTQKMDVYSDEKLIDVFNEQVSVNAWGTARASFLGAISNQLRKRSFDSSAICCKDSTSWKYKVKLINNKIIQLTDK